MTEKEIPSFRCPACKSDDTKRLPLIYEMGVSAIEAGTIGVGASANGLGVGGASTSGTVQTLLAEKVAPPEKISLARWIVAAGIVFLLIANIMPAWFLVPVGIAMLAGLVWLQRRFQDFNQNEYPNMRRKWERTFMCLRCGHQFEPDMPEETL